MITLVSFAIKAGFFIAALEILYCDYMYFRIRRRSLYMIFVMCLLKHMMDDTIPDVFSICYGVILSWILRCNAIMNNGDVLLLLISMGYVNIWSIDKFMILLTSSTILHGIIYKIGYAYDFMPLGPSIIFATSFFV